jgi:hypothetical protein
MRNFARDLRGLMGEVNQRLPQTQDLMNMLLGPAPTPPPAGGDLGALLDWGMQQPGISPLGTMSPNLPKLGETPIMRHPGLRNTVLRGPEGNPLLVLAQSWAKGGTAADRPLLNFSRQPVRGSVYFDSSLRGRAPRDLGVRTTPAYLNVRRPLNVEAPVDPELYAMARSLNYRQDNGLPIFNNGDAAEILLGHSMGYGGGGPKGGIPEYTQRLADLGYDSIYNPGTAISELAPHRKGAEEWMSPAYVTRFPQDNATISVWDRSRVFPALGTEPLPPWGPNHGHPIWGGW